MSIFRDEKDEEERTILREIGKVRELNTFLSEGLGTFRVYYRKGDVIRKIAFW